MLSLLTRFGVDYTYTTTTTSGHGHLSALFAGPLLILWLAFAVLVIAGLWKTFTKAGRPGWAAIVPFYNVWVLSEVAGKPGWLGLLGAALAIIPVVGWIGSVIIGIIIALGVARNFGKSDIFGVVGLFLFSFIGYLILGFGDAQYKGSAPVGATTSGQVTPPADSPPTPPVTPEGDKPADGSGQTPPPVTPSDPTQPPA